MSTAVSVSRVVAEPHSTLVRPPQPRLLRDIVADQLDSILESSFGRGSQIARMRGVFDLLTAKSLKRPAVPPFDGLSCINANGLPFQWVFRLMEGRQGFGFLCEVGEPGQPPRQRFEETAEQLVEACRIAGVAKPRFMDDVLQLVAPGGQADWPAHWRSGMWIGVAASGPRIAFKPYFNLTQGTCRDRWLRAGHLLQALGRTHALQRLCALSGPCSADSWPAGLAVDLDQDGGAGRVKIYFRSGVVTPAWLARWYDQTGLSHEAPALRRLLDIMGPTGPNFPQSGLVVCLEIHPDNSLSLKTDLAVTKWFDSDAEILQATQAFAPVTGIAPDTVAEAWQAVCALPPSGTEAAVLRYVGLGSEPDGPPHVNLYLEPPIATSTPPVRSRAPSLRQSIVRGLRALVRAQKGGHWTDFALPVGQSDAWVTAHTLAALPLEHPGDIKAAVERGLDWLEANRSPGGGWGYNSAVPNDADSTAWAVIALRKWGRVPHPEALAFLHGCRGIDGRFATYPANTSPKSGWAQRAPDVTMLGVRALGLDHAGLSAGALAEAVLTPAYWWTSPLYNGAMALNGGLPVPPDFRRRVIEYRPVAAFERGLQLSCRLGLGLSSGDIAMQLVKEQRANGLWQGSARLRLSKDDVAEPWSVIDSGALYVDQNGIFTTATVLNALGDVAQF